MHSNTQVAIGCNQAHTQVQVLGHMHEHALKHMSTGHTQAHKCMAGIGSTYN